MKTTQITNTKIAESFSQYFLVLYNNSPILLEYFTFSSFHVRQDHYNSLIKTQSQSLLQFCKIKI